MKTESLELIEVFAKEVSRIEGSQYGLKPYRIIPIDHDRRSLWALLAMCEVLNLDLNQIKSKCRKKKCAYGRHIVSKYLKEHGMTLQAIGQKLGGRDHATVINSINTYNDLVVDTFGNDEFKSIDREFREKMEEFTQV